MIMKRGILRDFDAVDYTATVEMAGSLSTWLTGLRVARNIDASDLVAGRSVAVYFFDSGNPRDAVLLAVWT